MFLRGVWFGGDVWALALRLSSSAIGEGSFTLNLEVSYGICSTRDGASLASNPSV